MISKNSRGSEWRRWDLHVHTPESGMNNGFDDWDSYIKSLFFKAIEKEIAVIGITDYFTIDGYKKILDCLKNEGELNRIFDNDHVLIEKIKKVKILPNVEFRLKTLVNNRRVNYHIIFSDEISINDIEENFLHEIDFEYEGAPDGPGNTRKLKKCNLEDLGKKIKEEQPSFNGTHFSVGCSVAAVDNSQIMHILETHKDIFSGKYFIVVPVDEDLSSISWNSQEHMVRKCLYQEANMFFSSNKNTIDFGLGKKSSSVNSFIAEFKSLKPCIHGSDAHSEDKLFEPDQNRYCWIKADPSFNGLKQIVFEPEQRVKIQGEKPENKSDYQVIDSITFDNSDMGNQVIEFNQNLNTVIGGRSSGKSLLLGCLVKSIDDNLFAKDQEKNGKYNRYVATLSSGARVKWKDGTNDRRKIIYYSQSEISASVREDENGISGINNLIERIVKSDVEKNQQIQKYEDFLTENRTNINEKINTYCDLKRQILEKKQKIDDVGTLSGIIAEIAKINEKITSVKQSIDGYLNEQEDAQFNQLKKELAEKTSQVELLNADIAQLSDIKNRLSFPSIESLIVKLSNDTKADIEKEYIVLKKEFEEKWCLFIDKKNTALLIQKNICDRRIEEIRNESLYIKGIDVQKTNTALALQDKLLKDEERKRDLVSRLNVELNNLVALKDACEKDIYSLFKLYEEKIQVLSETLSLKKDDVEINANVRFLRNRFYEKALQNLNKKNVKVKSMETYLLSNEEAKAIPLQPEDVFRGITSGDFNTIKKDFQQVMVDMFTENYFTISYDVNYGNDSLSEMSEGKKAYIVLRLLLDFDDSLCPIIIDQPEDDLDNRTIYGDLVKYIREQKTKRQIILATHNPNVVVGADAELVAVANQNGCDSKNQDQVKFEYFANSLENSYIDENCSTMLLSKGIREHVCEILEGGDEAFRKREQKYKRN